MAERAIEKYEKPRMELANNGVTINCGIRYASVAKAGVYDSCSTWDTLTYVYPFAQLHEAFAKLKELGTLAGLPMESLDEEAAEAGK